MNHNGRVLQIQDEKFGVMAVATFQKPTTLSLPLKQYSIQHNVGKIKYFVSYCDGIKKHTDGSTFYDGRTFTNKEKLHKFISELESEGYTKE